MKIDEDCNKSNWRTNWLRCWWRSSSWRVKSHAGVASWDLAAMGRQKDAFTWIQSGSKPKALEIAQYADLRQMNEHKQTLMFAAAGRPLNKGSAEILCQILQKRGLAVDTLDTHHQTPLFAAAREGNAICVDWLIAQGCAVDHLDCRGETPLCVAFRHSQMEIIMVLLKHGASLGVRDTYGGRQPPFFADPIFRRAFLEKRAETAETMSSPKKRKRGPAEDQPLWKRFRGDLALRCTGQNVMTQWAYKDEVVPEETIPEAKCRDILAQNDEFMIIVPPPEATARIRVLEREFALDHADCLRGHPMHGAMAPDEWADFSGVPVNEADAHKLIYNLLKKGSETQSIICCVEKSTGCICGYLRFGYAPENTLMLQHLKVQREHQRRGIATLMLEGSVHLARERHQRSIVQMSLKVFLRNHNALGFYQRIGFQHSKMPAKRPKSALAEWSLMKKRLWDLFIVLDIHSGATQSHLIWNRKPMENMNAYSRQSRVGWSLNCYSMFRASEWWAMADWSTAFHSQNDTDPNDPNRFQYLTLFPYPLTMHQVLYYDSTCVVHECFFPFAPGILQRCKSFKSPWTIFKLQHENPGTKNGPMRMLAKTCIRFCQPETTHRTVEVMCTTVPNITQAQGICSQLPNLTPRNHPKPMSILIPWHNIPQEHVLFSSFLWQKQGFEPNCLGAVYPKTQR